MTSYQNAADDIDCESADTMVFIGNVGLSDFQEPRADVANPATAILHRRDLGAWQPGLDVPLRHAAPAD